MAVDDYGIEVLKKAGEQVVAGSNANYRIKTLSKISDDNSDTSTYAVKVIDYEHYEIHAGSHFFVTGFETVNDAAQIDFVLTTPNSTKWLHLLFQVNGTSRTEYYAYEGATISGGTSVSPINNNRNSLNASVATIVKNPTVSATGTLLSSASMGLEGVNKNAAGIESTLIREDELVLKQNTTYLFRIISRDDGNIISYRSNWYEHTNK